MKGKNCPNCKAINIPTKAGLKRFCWRCGFEISPNGLDRPEDRISLVQQVDAYTQGYKRDESLNVIFQLLVISALLVFSGFIYNYFIPPVLGKLMMTPIAFILQTVFWAGLIYGLTSFACYLQRINDIGGQN